MHLAFLTSNTIPLHSLANQFSRADLHYAENMPFRYDYPHLHRYVDCMMEMAEHAIDPATSTTFRIVSNAFKKHEKPAVALHAVEYALNVYGYNKQRLPAFETTQADKDKHSEFYHQMTQQIYHLKDDKPFRRIEFKENCMGLVSSALRDLDQDKIGDAMSAVYDLRDAFTTNIPTGRETASLLWYIAENLAHDVKRAKPKRASVHAI